MLKPSTKSDGFSLIELAVVMAGLTILSSFAIPNVIKYFDYASVDEAKSLLNTAAADCLQNLRRDGETGGTPTWLPISFLPLHTIY